MKLPMMLALCLAGTAATAVPNNVRLPADGAYRVQQDSLNGEVSAATERLHVVAQYNWFAQVWSTAQLDFGYGMGGFWEDPQTDFDIGTEKPVDEWLEAVESVASSGDVLAPADKQGGWDTSGFYMENYELKVNGGPMAFVTDGYGDGAGHITIYDPNGGDLVAAPPLLAITAPDLS